MHITTAIERSTLADIFPEIANTARVSISFWGSRRISVPGYEGFAPIDSLAERVMELAQTNNFEFTLEERRKGKIIAERITQLYNESDQLVANSNYFTRLCCAIQEFFTQYSPSIFPLRTTSLTRYLWEDPWGSGFNRVFHCYTPRQFSESFKQEPPENQIGNPFNADKRFRHLKLIGEWNVRRQRPVSVYGPEARVDWEGGVPGGDSNGGITVSFLQLLLEED